MRTASGFRGRVGGQIRGLNLRVGFETSVVTTPEDIKDLQSLGYLLLFASAVH